MPLEKTPTNYSICQLCGYQGKNKQSIIVHIQQSHKDCTFKQYYDLFFKEQNEGICEVCGKNTRWNGKNYKKNGYRYYTPTCGSKCASINPRFVKQKQQKTFDLYGVKHFSQRKDVRDKISKKNKENIKKSLIKARKTILKRYGSIENYNKIRLKHTKITNLKKYGVEYPLLNKEIVKKTIIKGNITSKLHLKIKKYLDLEKLGFKSEQMIDNYIVDEVNHGKRIIIEINGDYVHANPHFYNANDNILLKSHKYTAQEKWKYDEIRKLHLASHGYIILTIWQSDDIKIVKQKLNILLENYK